MENQFGQGKRATQGVSEAQWRELAALAWRVRESSFVVGKTKVGAAALSMDGSVFGGCNVEHRYRCHDVHAEVNAITSMVAANKRELKAIVVVAERERFTPCGGCLDWIFQFGGADCLIAVQNTPGGPLTIWSSGELMPYYPE